MVLGAYDYAKKHGPEPPPPRGKVISTVPRSICIALKKSLIILPDDFISAIFLKFDVI